MLYGSRASSIEYPVSSIEYPVSSIENAASSIAIAFLLLAVVFVQTVVCDDEAGQEAKVIDVVDGVTIIVSYGGNPVSCVYIGVSAPESENPLRSTGSEARQINKNLVEGKIVRLEFDERKYDKYGRLLAYVYCDDVFVNAELIRQGYGSVMIVSPNTKHAEHFLKLETEAREAKRGLWADPGPMDAPTQSVASLEKQVALIVKKIDELSSKIDQLFEIIKELQSQPKGVASPAHRPDQGKRHEQVNAGPTEEQSDQVVYVTRSGKKYHKLGCRYLIGNYDAITLDEAERRGLQPCGVCFPEKVK
jgi:micrococcal nuclease